MRWGWSPSSRLRALTSGALPTMPVAAIAPLLALLFVAQFVPSRKMGTAAILVLVASMAGGAALPISSSENKAVWATWTAHHNKSYAAAEVPAPPSCHPPLHPFGLRTDGHCAKWGCARITRTHACIHT